MVDKDFNFRIASPSFTELYKIQPELVYPGAPLKGILAFRAERGDYGPGNPKTLVKERLQGYLGEEISNLEDTLPDGRVVQIYQAPTPEGGVGAVFNDITERKRAEEEVKENEQQLKAILDTVPSLVNVKDFNHRYIVANRYQRDFFGFKDEEWVGETSESISPEHGKRQHIMDSKVLIVSIRHVPPDVMHHRFDAPLDQIPRPLSMI
jgi:PAS domain-containing protein